MQLLNLTIELGKCLVNKRRYTMTRAGDEMILQLASLLGTDTVKTAAKKKEDKKEEKEDKKDEKKEEEEEKEDDKDEKKKDKKEEKKEKKASVMSSVLKDLVKLASELDELGAEEASDLVDDALRSIVQNINNSVKEEEV